jgi:hypothetical protein
MQWPSQAPAKLQAATSPTLMTRLTSWRRWTRNRSCHSLGAVGDPPTPATGNPSLSNGGNRTGRSDYARRAGLPRSDDHNMPNIPVLQAYECRLGFKLSLWNWTSG